MGHARQDTASAGSAQDLGSATALIERERDLVKAREDVARGVDAQATAIKATALALVTLGVTTHILSHSDRGPFIAAGILLLLSALAGGIARLPAPPPFKALLRPSEKRRVLDLFGPVETDAACPAPETLWSLGRFLGKQIRDSEAELQGFKPDTPPAEVIPALLDHWRARNRLSRYRMHSKSAWFTLSLVLLYIAVVALLVAAGIRSNVLG